MIDSFRTRLTDTNLVWTGGDQGELSLRPMKGKYGSGGLTRLRQPLIQKLSDGT